MTATGAPLVGALLELADVDKLELDTEAGATGDKLAELNDADASLPANDDDEVAGRGDTVT
ncbi:hypothetical protein LTR28_012542 [Elasticomyces elasticus]|nr:hypothetical protein LTR28_012542 [Elasticomyces elasticus]